MSDPVSGVLKWFNFHRGYGFLVRSGQADILVRASTLREGKVCAKQVRPGLGLTVEVEQTRYGLRATRVLEVSEWGSQP
jgi:cold shock CspA family protein